MAASLINTECKRYGCMKNLLACFANCRYNTRCDDLRNEIEGKTEQAVKDINNYLGERGRPPIAIQFLKRGLKFAAASSHSAEAIKPKQQKAPLKLTGLTGLARKSKKDRKSKSSRMERKSKKTLTKGQQATDPSSSVTAVSADAKAEKKPAKGKSRPRKTGTASSNGNAARKRSKTYIILDGKSAAIVDERGLMQHILSGSSPDARYFEATEVEARLQIVAMR